MIGVGITTRNRNDILDRHLQTHFRGRVPGPLVIVDDASETPYNGATYRFDQNVGIATGKNKCIELLYDLGVTEFFLFDDDSYPIVDDWYVPYVESREPHLMASYQPSRRPFARVIYQDSELKAMSRPQGWMLYANRVCIDRVGGMDAANFGKWGGEHTHWSNRIFNAGLTTFRFADVPNGSSLVSGLDFQGGVERLPKDFRVSEWAKSGGRELWDIDSDGFVAWK